MSNRLLGLLRRRTVTNRVRWAIDNLLPPLISDARWFNRALAYGMFGGRDFDLDFKEKALSMTPTELRDYSNRLLGGWAPYRDSDTTPRQIQALLSAARGESLLEVGCGSGHVALSLAAGGLKVTACDFLDLWVEKLRSETTAVSFCVATAEDLHWPDKAFGTVICSHTLEHVLDPQACIAEMLRVAQHRLLIVVPRQQYKRYTIDTHIQFFPSEAILRRNLNLPDADVELIDGDWFVTVEQD